MRPLISASEIAAGTGISVNTWRHWHKNKIGPPAYKLNGRVVYDPAEVDAWIRARRTIPAGEEHLDPDTPAKPDPRARTRSHNSRRGG